MGVRSWIHGAVGLAMLVGAASAGASDLRLPQGGRVTVEFLKAREAPPSTLSIAAPAVAVGPSGCRVEDAGGLPGQRLVTGREAQRGCRVTLDADAGAPGVQPFPSGATLNFRLCVQSNPSPTCERVWSSLRTANTGGAEHLRTVSVSDRIFRLGWEDLLGGSDPDFDDHIVVVRVDGDRDGDGLWDDWETSGIDADGDGDVDLTLPGADPAHKDVFVELDWMDCAVGGEPCDAAHDHKPSAEAIAEARAVYAAAPVGNPDGAPGVRLHVELSDRIPHRPFVDLGCFQQHSFDELKALHFEDLRRFAYHYGIFGHSQGPEDHGSAGCSEIGGNDFLVTLADWTSVIGQFAGRGPSLSRLHAGSLLHELGHNLGLRHGGGDDIDFKPNYLSAMNHRYQYRGIPPHGILDYSRTVLPTLDELSVSEQQSLPAAVLYGCPNADTLCLSKAGAPINWNCDGGIQGGTRVLDLNRDRFCIRPRVEVLQTCAVPDARCQAVDDEKISLRLLDADGQFDDDWYQDGENRTCDLLADPADQQIRPVGSRQPNRLRGFSDWDHLAYAFQADLDHGLGSEISNQEEIEPRVQDLIVITEFRTDPVGVVAPGATVVYSTRVRNEFDPIDNGVIEQRLPAGTIFVPPCTVPQGSCQLLSGGLVRALLPPLAHEEETTLQVTVRVPASTPEGTRLRSTVKVGEGIVPPEEECLPGEEYAPFKNNRDALSILVSSCPAGTNVIQGTPGSDRLDGTEGDDCLLGGDGEDVLEGRGGNDVLIGGGGNDILSGGAGDDRLVGSGGNDQMDGGDGADVLLGGEGEDILSGGYGDDQLDGGPGSDQCAGGGSAGDRFVSCEQQSAARLDDDAKAEEGAWASGAGSTVPLESRWFPECHPPGPLM